MRLFNGIQVPASYKHELLKEPLFLAKIAVLAKGCGADKSLNASCQCDNLKKSRGLFILELSYHYVTNLWSLLEVEEGVAGLDLKCFNHQTWGIWR